MLGDEAAHGETIQHLVFPDDDQKVLEMEKLADGGLNEVRTKTVFDVHFCYNVINNFSAITTELYA